VGDFCFEKERGGGGGGGGGSSAGGSSGLGPEGGPAGAGGPGGPPFGPEPLDATLSRLGASEAGLSSAEAAARLGRFGLNELAPPRRFATLRELLHYLANPLVLILLVASAVSAAFGQVASAIIVALMLVLSVALNFTQAYRSRQAADRLRRQVGQRATVVRDGAPGEVPARLVVPGDLVQLTAGDLVPADARLVSPRDLFVNEVPLPGGAAAPEEHSAPGRR